MPKPTTVAISVFTIVSCATSFIIACADPTPVRDGSGRDETAAPTTATPAAGEAQEATDAMTNTADADGGADVTTDATLPDVHSPPSDAGGLGCHLLEPVVYTVTPTLTSGDPAWCSSLATTRMLDLTPAGIADAGLAGPLPPPNPNTQCSEVRIVDCESKLVCTISGVTTMVSMNFSAKDSAGRITGTEQLTMTYADGGVLFDCSWDVVMSK